MIGQWYQSGVVYVVYGAKGTYNWFYQTPTSSDKLNNILKAIQREQEKRRNMTKNQNSDSTWWLYKIPGQSVSMVYGTSNTIYRYFCKHSIDKYGGELAKMSDKELQQLNKIICCKLSEKKNL